MKSHQGAKSAFAGTGVKLVFIKRNSSSENVFTEPSVPWDQIPKEVRMEWFSTSYSLSRRWIQEFQAVTLVDNVEATSDEVMREISFLVKAETSKTPSKRKRYLDNEDATLGDCWEIVKHNRALPADKEDLDELIGIGLRRGLITEAVAYLETSVVQMGDGMREVTELTKDRFVKTEKELDLLNVVLQKIKCNLGVPVSLDSRFVAPTLWGSTGFIGEEVLRLSHDVQEVKDAVQPVAQKLTAFLRRLKKIKRDLRPTTLRLCRSSRW